MSNLPIFLYLSLIFVSIINRLRELYKVRSLEYYNGIRGSYRITVNDSPQEVDLYLSTYSEDYSLTLHTKDSNRIYRVSGLLPEELDKKLERITSDIEILIGKEKEEGIIPEIEDFYNIRTNINYQLESIDEFTVRVGRTIAEVFTTVALCGSKLERLYVRVIMNHHREFVIEDISLSYNSLLDGVHYIFKSPQDMFLKVCDILVSHLTSDGSVNSNILRIVSIISANVTK